MKFFRDHSDLPSLTAITNAAREQCIKDLIEVLRILQHGNNLAKEYLAMLEGDEAPADVWDFTSLERGYDKSCNIFSLGTIHCRHVHYCTSVKSTILVLASALSKLPLRYGLNQHLTSPPSQIHAQPVPKLLQRALYD